MPHFPVHTLESAPEGSRETLLQVKTSLGAVPNLAAAMAESPSLVRGFFDLRSVYYADSSLEPVEIQALSIANAFENGCSYCVAIHSAFAKKEGLSDESLDALRTGNDTAEPRLAALVKLSRALIAGRGHVKPHDLEAFYAAGLTPANALDVVLGIAVSILANYSHHLSHAPLDEAFRAHAWTPPDASRTAQTDANRASASVAGTAL